MSLPLLRACEATAGAIAVQWFRSGVLRRCSGQATFWLQGHTQDPFLQLEQLHTSAAAAVAAAVSAQQQAGLQTSAGPSQASGTDASGTNSSSSSSYADQLQPIQPSNVLTSLLTGLGSKEIDPQHIGLYYDLNKSLVPEAFQAFHQAFYSPRPAKQQRKGGCRSLQAEFNLTHSSSLMWRRSSHELMQALSSGSVPRVHLKGAAGAGKSIAVVQIVEWARSNGWIAMYIPSAGQLTRGGFFYKRGDSNTYDTIISAQHTLKSMADSHAADLTRLRLQLPASRQLLNLPADAAATSAAASNSPTQGDAAAVVPAGADGPAAGAVASKEGRKGKKGSGAAAAADVEGSLMQLVMAGLSTDDDGMLAVECCLALIQELAAVSETQPVLLAVDDYNALYWQTEYGRTVFVKPDNGPDYQYRKPVRVSQLNLARNLRLLERSDLGACRVLVADSASNRVDPDVSVPSNDAGVYYMPRFSEVETAHALHFYHERGLTAEPPSARQVAAMRALTNGSGADLRKWCLKVAQTDMGLL